MGTRNLNTRIVRYFLENSRITFLCLISLIIFGVATIFSLRTTGFPSPSINIVTVTTVYPGASAQTVTEQITKPLEAVLKDVEGVKTYSSTSANNFSNVVITLDENANVDTAKQKLTSAAQSIALPEAAQAPSIASPRVSGDEYYYALVRKDTTTNNEETYKVLETLKSEISKIKDTNQVVLNTPIEKKVVVTADVQKLTSAGLTYTDIANQLQTWGLALPVTNGVVIEDRIYNLSLSISGSSLDDIRNIRLVSTTKPTVPVRLGDIASVTEEYIPSNDFKTFAGYIDGDTRKASPATIVSINVADSADLSVYDPEFQNIVKKYFDYESNEFKSLSEQDRKLFENYAFISVLSTPESNEQQTSEVIAGLVGEKWHNNLGYLGFVFGGIELVFLMMLFLVSWRAAVISALAIPLSFFFSTIYVKLTGNDLNTLVLFSLVLVIGLVVDPALVVLESIQRNLDNGLPRKEAVLQAINEIGNGLFLAVLTSILVFVPFGVVSGFFGEIISYIPLTIIPAIIGSYVVPLVFLSWIASKFLKRSKHTSESEEENLWPAARWTMRLNSKILHSHWSVRLLIVVLSLVIPLTVAFFYTSTGKVKQVEFAQPDESDYISVSTINFPQGSPEKLAKNDEELVKEIITQKDISYVAPIQSSREQGGNTYYVRLKPNAERQDTALTIAESIESKLNDKLGKEYFNISSAPISNGPPASQFPLSIAIKTDNLEAQKKAALDLTKILTTVCRREVNTFELDQNCKSEDKAVVKVDNGYEGKESEFLEVRLNREKLLLNPVQPIELKNALASLYKINDGKKVATFKEDGKDLEIILEKSVEGPGTLDQLKAVQVRTLAGTFVPLSAVADVQEVDTVAAIRRVKGENLATVNAKLAEDSKDQSSIAAIKKLATDEFNKSYLDKYTNLSVGEYSESDTSSFIKSFQELGIALLLAIVLTYLVLVVFFNSFLQPLVILFSIPLAFIGIFPALHAFGGGQLGFLEIIGIIILVGLVENVAIFLIDAANQKIREGWDSKKAIVFASGVRFRPIVLTKLTTLISTAPLAILSLQYRSLSVVIIFGLLTSGIVSLFTSPILFIAFRSLSTKIRGLFRK